MKAFLLTLLATSALLPAATLTKGERERAMSELHASRKMLIDAVSGLSDAQLNWRAAPDKWSVADVAEHLALSEGFLFGLYQKTAAGPADPLKKAANPDEAFLTAIRNRDQKFKAPEPIAPKKSFANTPAAIAAFKERRDKTIAYVETTEDQDLRAKVVPDAGMDAYQVFLMIAGHTERHVAQIAEVKASSGFPAK